MKLPIATLLLVLALPQVAWSGWQTNGIPVSDATSVQANPVAVAEGIGGVIVAWVDNRSGGADIYAQRINSAGVPQWTADGVLVCDAPGLQFSLDIVVDPGGGTIIAWMDFRSNNSYDIYAQRLNASGVAQWMADGIIVSDGPNDQYFPRLASNGASGAIVVWQDYRNTGLTNEDIYGARITVAGALSDPAGIAINTAVAAQLYPTPIPFGSGGAIVVWQRAAGGGTYDIAAARVSGTGTVIDAGGLTVCAATGSQTNPALIQDPVDGGAIICWPDYRAAIGVYAQKMNSSGAMLWTANGVKVSGAAFSPAGERPGIVAGPGGDAVIAWSSFDGSDYDVYAQRVNASGARQWIPNDVTVCTAASNQLDLRVSSDNAGGVVAAWSDARDSQLDIYAQRVNSSGVTQWTVDGVPVCDAAFAQTLPAVVSDGTGGSIVAWQDDRVNQAGTQSDIYAQRVRANGDLPTAVGDVPAAGFVVRDAFPNPFSRSTDLEVRLHEDADVTIDVFDVAGRRVRAFSLPQAKAGELRVQFDGRDHVGRELASGVYFYRVTASGVTQARKLVILR